VKAITSITKEKVWKKEVGRLKSGSLEVSNLNARGKRSM
jgi:hypothetical protein